MKVGPFWLIGRDRRVLVGPHDLFGFVMVDFPVIRRVRRRYLWLVIGGPLANLIVGLLLHAVAFVSAGEFAVYIGTAGTVSLWLAALNLIPTKSTSAGSDGWQIIRLFRKRAIYASWLASLALNIASANGARPSVWRRRWLEKSVAGDPKDPSHFAAHVRYYAWASDQKNIQLAADHLERVLSLGGTGKCTRDFCSSEAAIFQAWHKRDAAKSEAWAERTSNFSTVQQLRYFISIRCCRGEFESAIVEWEKGLSLLQSISPSKQGNSIIESWKEWRDEIEVRRNADQSRAMASTV